MKKALCILSLTAATLAAANAGILTQFTFEGDVTTPSTGAGSAALIGGITATFSAGNGVGSGWNTTGYAAQSTASGTRGVSFLVDTTSFTDITIDFDHRASGTASRWAQLDYTLNGGSTWTIGFWNNAGLLSPQDTFYPFTVDLTSISGANNNPGFGFRIVSIFSPLAFDQNATLQDFTANSAYMRANSNASYTAGGGTTTGDYGTTGTWRFDNVTINAVPEPQSYALIIAGLLVAVVFFRRRQAARA